MDNTSLLETFESTTKAIATKMGMQDWVTPQLKQECLAIHADLVHRFPTKRRRSSSGNESGAAHPPSRTAVATHAAPADKHAIHGFTSPSHKATSSASTADKIFKTAQSDVKSRINHADINEIKGAAHPNKLVQGGLIPVLILASKIEPEALHDWKKITDYLKKENIIDVIHNLKPESIPADRIAAAKAAMKSADWNLKNLKNASYAAYTLAYWADAVVKLISPDQGSADHTADDKDAHSVSTTQETNAAEATPAQSTHSTNTSVTTNTPHASETPAPKKPSYNPNTLVQDFKHVNKAKAQLTHENIVMMRSYSLPPEHVHKALIPICMLLTNYSADDLKSWDKVKDILRDDGVENKIHALDKDAIAMHRLVSIKEYIQTCGWDVEAAESANAPAGLMAKWVDLLIKLIEHHKIHPPEDNPMTPVHLSKASDDSNMLAMDKDFASLGGGGRGFDVGSLPKETKKVEVPTPKPSAPSQPIPQEEFEEIEHAYKKAHAELNAKVSQSDIQLMKSFDTAPKALESVLPSIIMLVSNKSSESLYEWENIREYLRKEDLLDLIHKLDIDHIPEKQYNKVKEAIKLEGWNQAELKRGNLAASYLADWAQTLVEYVDAKKRPIIPKKKEESPEPEKPVEPKKAPEVKKPEPVPVKKVEEPKKEPEVKKVVETPKKVEEHHVEEAPPKPMEPEMLKAIEAGEANKNKISEADLKTLRTLLHPSKEIHTAFIPIAMLLSKYSAQDLADWSKVKEILRKDNALDLIHHLKHDTLPYKRVTAVKHFIETSPDWHLNNFKVASLTANYVASWVDAVIKAYECLPRNGPALDSSAKKESHAEDSHHKEPAHKPVAVKREVKETAPAPEEDEAASSGKAAGDALLVAGFLVYLPPLPFAQRKMVFEHWKYEAYLAGFEFSPDVNASEFLANTAEKSMLKTHGNSLGVENSIIKRENKKVTRLYEESHHK